MFYNKWQLLGGAAGVLDIFGSHIDNSTVSGVNGGYTVQSTNGDEPIAGGFIGYANLARMSKCTAGSEDASFSLKQVTLLVVLLEKQVMNIWEI